MRLSSEYACVDTYICVGKHDAVSFCTAADTAVVALGQYPRVSPMLLRINCKALPDVATLPLPVPKRVCNKYLMVRSECSTLIRLHCLAEPTSWQYRRVFRRNYCAIYSKAVGVRFGHALGCCGAAVVT